MVLADDVSGGKVAGGCAGRVDGQDRAGSVAVFPVKDPELAGQLLSQFLAARAVPAGAEFEDRALVVDWARPGQIGEAAAVGERERVPFRAGGGQAAVNGVLGGRENALARDGDQPEVQAVYVLTLPAGDAGPRLGAVGRPAPRSAPCRRRR